MSWSFWYRSATLAILRELADQCFGRLTVSEVIIRNVWVLTRVQSGSEWVFSRTILVACVMKGTRSDGTLMFKHLNAGEIDYCAVAGSKQVLECQGKSSCGK